MPAEQRHRIQSCRFEIRAARREDAPALQEEALADWQPALAAALERVAERLASPDRILRIDSLDIAASVATLRDPLQAVAHLEDAIRERLAELGVFAREAESAPAAKSERALLGEWLRVFFESGRLPWWQPPTSRESFQDAFETWIRFDPTAAEWLRSLASRRPSVVRRVESQLSQRALASLLEALAGGPDARSRFSWFRALALGENRDAPASEASPLARLWRRAAASSAAPLEPDAIAAVALPSLLRRLSDALGRGDSGFLDTLAARFRELPPSIKRALARALFAELGRLEPELKSEPLARFAEPTPAMREVIGARFAFVPIKLIQSASLWARAAPLDGSDEAASSASPRALPGRPAIGAEFLDTADSETRGSGDEASDFSTGGDRIYVENAGLILLAPFLPAFFSNCGIRLALDPEERASADRAPGLLQRLAFPGQSAMEYALPLNKVLCGLPLEMPLPPEDTLDASQAEACEALLRAAIEHWGRLGSTSLDAFRSTFLARAGSLESTDFGWTLRVERGPFDVLLDTIPWTFKTVRFSWMPQPLLVEW